MKNVLKWNTFKKKFFYFVIDWSYYEYESAYPILFNSSSSIQFTQKYLYYKHNEKNKFVYLYLIDYYVARTFIRTK